jgi:AcrR family transcriptional regulator
VASPAPGRNPPTAPRAASPTALPIDQSAQRRPRRTQAERRATTRSALLDAALQCLIDEGYGGLTTRNVAERAGVSQGTQMHYFPTRVEFLAEAVRHLARKLDAELREQDRLRARSERRRLEEMLDHIWEIHTRPVFQATIELWVAARTDHEIRGAMDAVARDLTRLIAQGSQELFPELMAKPRAREVQELALAAMRGLSLLRFTGDEADVERRWRRSRAHLLELYDAL